MSDLEKLPPLKKEDEAVEIKFLKAIEFAFDNFSIRVEEGKWLIEYYDEKDPDGPKLVTSLLEDETTQFDDEDVLFLKENGIEFTKEDLRIIKNVFSEKGPINVRS
jgi:hypothetical protein